MRLKCAIIKTIFLIRKKNNELKYDLVLIINKSPFKEIYWPAT